MASQRRVVAYYRQFELEAEFRHAPLKLYASGYDLHANLQSAIAHKLQMVYIPGLVRDRVFKAYLEKYYENRIYLDFWRLTRRIKACFRGNAALGKQVSLAELVRKDKDFKKNRLLKSGVLNEPERKTRKGGKHAKSGKRVKAKGPGMDLNLDFLDRPKLENQANITGLLNNISRLISKSNIELEILQMPDPKLKLSFMNLARRTPEAAKAVGRLVSLGNIFASSNQTNTGLGTGNSSRLQTRTGPSASRKTPTRELHEFRVSEVSVKSPGSSHPRRRAKQQTRLNDFHAQKQPQKQHVIMLPECIGFGKGSENYSTSPFSPTELASSKQNLVRTDIVSDRLMRRGERTYESTNPKSLLSNRKPIFQTPVHDKSPAERLETDLHPDEMKQNLNFNGRRLSNLRARSGKKFLANHSKINLSKSESRRNSKSPYGSPDQSSSQRFSLSRALTSLGKVVNENFPFELKSLSSIKPNKLVLKAEKLQKSPKPVTSKGQRSSKGKSSWRKVGFSKFKMHNFSQRFSGRGRLDEGQGSRGEMQKNTDTLTPYTQDKEIMSVEVSQTIPEQRKIHNLQGRCLGRYWLMFFEIGFWDNVGEGVIRGS